MMGLYPFRQIVSEVLMMSNTLQDFYNFANTNLNDTVKEFAAMPLKNSTRYFTQKQQKKLQVLHRAMLGIVRGIEARCISLLDYETRSINPNLKYIRSGNKVYPCTKEEVQALHTLFDEVQEVLQTGYEFFGTRLLIIERLYNFLMDSKSREYVAIEGVHYRVQFPLSLLVTREPMSKITDPLKLWIADLSGAKKGFELYATLAYDDTTNKIVIEKHNVSEQTLASQEAEHLQTTLDSMLQVLGSVGTLDSYEHIDTTGYLDVFDGTYTGARSVFSDMVWYTSFKINAVLDNLIAFKG